MEKKTKRKKVPVVIKNGWESYTQMVENLIEARPRVAEFYQEGIRKAGRDARKILQESIKLMKALRKDIADVSRARKEKGAKKTSAKKSLKPVAKKAPLSGAQAVETKE